MTTGSNYFEIFGLPPAYEIDLTALEAAYERLTLEHHPDFFSTAGKPEQAHAQRMSAEVNEGYRVLRSEGRRSAYLLKLLANGQDLNTRQLPEGFLQEMFFLQEELDELGDDGDAETRATLKSQVDARVQQALEERKALFAQTREQATAEVLQAIQTNLNCEQYLRRLLERLEE